GAGTADTGQLYGPAGHGPRGPLSSEAMAVVGTLDGGSLDPDAPLLCADDLAAVRGDGVFETLLVRDGGACLVRAHLARLTHSARLMDLPARDLTAWRSAIDKAAAEWAGSTTSEGALRLVYSR